MTSSKEVVLEYVVPTLGAVTGVWSFTRDVDYVFGP